MTAGRIKHGPGTYNPDADMPQTCIDCGAPIGDDMLPTAGCWYNGQIAEEYRRQGHSEEEIKRALSSGGDPPCHEYHYLYNAEQSARRARRGWLIAILLALFVVGCLALVRAL